MLTITLTGKEAEEYIALKNSKTPAVEGGVGEFGTVTAPIVPLTSTSPSTPFELPPSMPDNITLTVDNGHIAQQSDLQDALEKKPSDFPTTFKASPSPMLTGHKTHEEAIKDLTPEEKVAKGIWKEEWIRKPFNWKYWEKQMKSIVMDKRAARSTFDYMYKTFPKDLITPSYLREKLTREGITTDSQGRLRWRTDEFDHTKKGWKRSLEERV